MAKTSLRLILMVALCCGCSVAIKSRATGRPCVTWISQKTAIEMLRVTPESEVELREAFEYFAAEERPRF